MDRGVGRMKNGTLSIAGATMDYIRFGTGAKTLIMLPGTGFVYSPVTQGAEAGFAHVLVDGNAVGKVPVVFGQTIEKEPEKEPDFFQKLFGRKEN